MIELKPVDETSFAQVIDLTVAEADQGLVAPNVRSLADCWLYRDNGDVFPYAVWAEEKVVGFLLIDIDEDDKQYMVWRVMIDRAHQGKGYGRQVLEAVIELAKSHPVCDHVRADYVKGNDKMAQLLKKLGFETFDQDEREIYARLVLERKSQQSERGHHG